MSKKTFILGIACFLLLMPTSVFAEDGFPNNPEEGYVNEGKNKVTLINPLGDINSFEQLITAILDAAFIIGLPVAVLFIAVAGFRFVWARGNPGQLESAKKNLLYTVVGIGIFFGAWTLAKIIEATIEALKIGGGS